MNTAPTRYRLLRRDRYTTDLPDVGAQQAADVLLLPYPDGSADVEFTVPHRFTVNYQHLRRIVFAMGNQGRIGSGPATVYKRLCALVEDLDGRFDQRTPADRNRARGKIETLLWVMRFLDPDFTIDGTQARVLRKIGIDGVGRYEKAGP